MWTLPPIRQRRAELNFNVAHLRELEVTEELSQADAYEERRDALNDAVLRILRPEQAGAAIRHGDLCKS